MKKKHKIIIQSQKNITTIITDYLKQASDPIKQMQQYLHWVTRVKYLIELHICWKMQGFRGYPFDNLLPISLQLAKQEWKQVSDWIQEYRKSPGYKKDMEEFSKIY